MILIETKLDEEEFIEFKKKKELEEVVNKFTAKFFKGKGINYRSGIKIVFMKIIFFLIFLLFNFII